MQRFRLKINKKAIKQSLASILGSIVMVTSIIPAYMLVSEPEVVEAAQASGPVSGNIVGLQTSGN